MCDGKQFVLERTIAVKCSNQDDSAAQEFVLKNENESSNDDYRTSPIDLQSG